MSGVADACTNIQQVTKEEEEEDTAHVDTWRNARVWVDFLGGLHQFVLDYYLSTKSFTWLAIVALEVFDESNMINFVI
jgi:hypothetical protein